MRSLRLWYPSCPKCFEQSTRLDWGCASNYWRLPMALATGFLLIPVGTVGLVCGACSERFRSLAANQPVRGTLSEFEAEELMKFSARISGKSLEELEAEYGSPSTEHGPRNESRWGKGWSEIIRYRREVDFAGVAPRGRTLRVSERVDGKLDISFPQKGK